MRDYSTDVDLSDSFHGDGWQKHNFRNCQIPGTHYAGGAVEYRSFCDIEKCKP